MQLFYLFFLPSSFHCSVYKVLLPPINYRYHLHDFKTSFIRINISRPKTANGHLTYEQRAMRMDTSSSQAWPRSEQRAVGTGASAPAKPPRGSRPPAPRNSCVMSQCQILRGSKSTTPARTRLAGSASSPLKAPEAGTSRNGQRTQLLECNSCRLLIYDAWKGVHCGHVICTDCMVRTSQELIHCQLCITPCVQEGNHAVCVVCFGCDLLCRCPERLVLAPRPGPETSSKKSIEFYKRIKCRPPPVVEGHCQRNEGEGSIIYKREIRRERRVVDERIVDNDSEETFGKLYEQIENFDQRLKTLEDNYEKMQNKVQDPRNVRLPQALFQSQYGIHPDAVLVPQDPVYEQRPEVAPNADSTLLQQQEQQPYYQQYQGPFQTQVYQAPGETLVPGMEQQSGVYQGPFQQQVYQTPGEAPVLRMEQQPGGIDDLLLQPQLLETMRQQFSQQENGYFPVDAEGNPLQPKAIMAVIQVRTTVKPDASRFNPQDGPYMDPQEVTNIVVENSIKIREIPEDEEVGAPEEKKDNDDVRGAKDRYRHAAGERYIEDNSCGRDPNLIRDLNGQAPDALPKKDAETSAELGNFVKHLANLYDKVSILEADNARLREGQIRLKKANAKMSDKVKSIVLEQSRAMIVPPQTLQVLAGTEQGQQATPTQNGGVGMSTTALQIHIEAVAEQSSSGDSSNTKDPTNGDGQQNGERTEKRSDRNVAVKSDIQLEIRNGPDGPVIVTQDTSPATAVGYAQVPPPLQNKGTARYHKMRRTSSLPTQPIDNTICTESELGTYKKRLDDMTDWYRSRRRRDMLIEQVTWGYLKTQLSNGCHFLDFISAFYWEVDKCSELHTGKTFVRDFRLFGGPIIDLSCKGLFRFVIDPGPSSITVYVEILISAKPKRDHRYHLRIGNVRSGAPFHDKLYTGEDMFGFKGVLSYPGTPCLGFFSIVVNVDSRELSKERTLSDTLILKLAKVQAS
ncbi:unnamed protein product [Ixodes hexagonus]